MYVSCVRGNRDLDVLEGHNTSDASIKPLVSCDKSC